MDFFISCIRIAHSAAPRSMYVVRNHQSLSSRGDGGIAFVHLLPTDNIFSAQMGQVRKQSEHRRSLLDVFVREQQIKMHRAA